VYFVFVCSPVGSYRLMHFPPSRTPSWIHTQLYVQLLLDPLVAVAVVVALVVAVAAAVAADLISRASYSVAAAPAGWDRAALATS
jgi:hypothetical protein